MWGLAPAFVLIILSGFSRDSDLLLRAARFTTGYVRLFGQEPAPSKCVLLSSCKAARAEMRGWVLSEEGHRWTVKLDVRDLGGHLDTTLRGWSSALSLRVRLVISRFDLNFALPLDFYGRVRVVRALFLPCALLEASYLSKGSFWKLRAAVMHAVWSRKQPLASSGAVLGLLYGPHGCDSYFCIVWLRCRLFRRYLSFRPVEVPRLYRLLDLVHDGCSRHGPIHALVAGARRIGFSWNSFMTHWDRPGLPGLSILLVLFSIFDLHSLMLGGIGLLLIHVLGGAFVVVFCLIFVVRISFLVPLMFVSVIRCFYVVSWSVVFGMVSCLVKFVVRLFFVASVVVLMVMAICFGNVLTLFLWRFAKILSFTIS